MKRRRRAGSVSSRTCCDSLITPILVILSPCLDVVNMVREGNACEIGVIRGLLLDGNIYIGARREFGWTELPLKRMVYERGRVFIKLLLLSLPAGIVKRF